MEDTYEEWLARYLRLEYGEDENDPQSLKASDLSYVGEFVIDGVPTKFWSYPTSGGPMWGIIEEHGEQKLACLTSTGPPLH